MRPAYCLAVALLASFAGAAAEPAVPSLPAAMAQQIVQIQKAALASPFGYELLRELSDGIGPRLSGTPGLELAVAHVARRASAAGLKVQQEPVLVPHWQRGIEQAELVDWPGHAPGLTQGIALTALGSSAATSAQGLTAEVLSVPDNATLLAMEKTRVAGKIVLFTAAFDEQMAEQGHGNEAYGRATAFRSHGPSLAASLGAAACLVRSAGGGHIRLPHTGQTVFDPGIAPIPAAALSAEDVELIGRLGKVRMHLTLTPQTLPDAVSANVLAELPGSETPEEIVLVSGHLDSWDLGTGALDDGAGIAIALDALRVIAASGLKPRRTLRFVAYTNEENGLAGAKAYAATHAGEIAKHVAVIESDLGAGHPTGFYARVTPETERLLGPLADALSPLGAGTAELTSRCPGADISPLCKAGVPGFAPRQDNRSYFMYHHTAADTFDKVNPQFLAENTALVATLLWALANGDALPRLPAQ